MNEYYHEQRNQKLLSLTTGIFVAWKKKIFVLLEYKKSTFMGNIQIYCGVR